jgi:hypothetical protein
MILCYWLLILVLGYIKRYRLLLIVNELYYNYNHKKDNDYKLNSINSLEYDDFYLIKYKYTNGKEYILFSNKKLVKAPYEENYIIEIKNSNKIVKSDEDIIMCEFEYNNGDRVDGLDIIKLLSGPIGDFYKEIEYNVFNLERFKKVFNLENLKSIEIMDSNGDKIEYK